MSIKQFFVSIAISLMSSFVFVQVTSAAEVISFSSKDLQGNTHAIEQYRGKWIVVNYWGIFCGPCLREMPELSIFHDQHRDKDAVVLGINQEDLPDKVMARFADKMKISFPLLNVFACSTSFRTCSLISSAWLAKQQTTVSNLKRKTWET